MVTVGGLELTGSKRTGSLSVCSVSYSLVSMCTLSFVLVRLNSPAHIQTNILADVADRTFYSYNYSGRT